ncbi:hypothetical protein [Sellimonas caecigallum]|uniref:Uncharacterized protein n=1 Tax=Sellimonas caecigallum TaxID=2592333 RepID=A0ABS7L6G1_9FIRM|nr:hypothetical protein [Sellimonas caecigallum]MBY0758512.1 hypothetical protein [Sellimonas caecigallum]
MKRKKRKGIIAAALAVVLVAATPLTTKAADRPHSWFGWRSTWAQWFNWSHRTQETQPETAQKLETPEITDASYRHNGVYSFLPDHLRASWTEVEGADHYDVVVTKKDGTSKTYRETVAGLLRYGKDDEFLAKCIAGGTVSVRSVDKDGNVSDWSEPEEISHNQLHLG